MKKTLIGLALVSMASTPALAKPGHGHSHGQHDMSKMDHSSMTAEQHRQMMSGKTKKNKMKHGDMTAEQHRQMVLVQRSQGGQRSTFKLCPPGLDKSNNGCVPPGQAKRNLQVGQTLPQEFRFNQIPQQFQNMFTRRDGFAYTFNNGSVFEIDQRTRQIVNIFTPRF